MHNAIKVALERVVTPPQGPTSCAKGNAHLLNELADLSELRRRVFTTNIRKRH